MGWNRFWNDPHRLQRASIQQRLQKHLTVPGHVGHMAQIRKRCRGQRGGHKLEYFFERWYKRPDRAHRLYWRTHPEYTA